VSLRGLWARLRYDKTASRPVSAITWLSVVSAAPMLNVLPADIALLGFRRD
jgi:hypothetical protein